MSDIKFVILGDNFAWDVTSSEGKLTWKKCGNTYDFIMELRKHKERIIDSETTGLNVFLNKVFSLAFNIDGTNYYANFQDYSQIEEIDPDFVMGPVMRALITDFLKDECLWIGHNIKFDRHIIKNTFGVGSEENFGIRWSLSDCLRTTT